jgi:hypothetical protein
MTSNSISEPHRSPTVDLEPIADGRGDYSWIATGSVGHYESLANVYKYGLTSRGGGLNLPREGMHIGEAYHRFGFGWQEGATPGTEHLSLYVEPNQFGPLFAVLRCQADILAP